MNVQTTIEPDGLLVEAAKGGDQDAFTGLVDRYRSLLRSISRSYFATGTADEDLAQEALIGLMKAVRDFRSDCGTFRTFLELCVRRQVITYIKTQTRLKHTPLNRSISLDAPRVSDDDEPLVETLASRDPIRETDPEDLEFLHNLTQRCSDLERHVLFLYSKGYSFEEMAFEVGKHWKAIDNAVWRIKVKARTLRAETKGYRPPPSGLAS
jgi:RNA polymerase sporulation-specific sigma factor